jgi:hypothetical protein
LHREVAAGGPILKLRRDCGSDTLDVSALPRNARRVECAFSAIAPQVANYLSRDRSARIERRKLSQSNPRLTFQDTDLEIERALEKVTKKGTWVFGVIRTVLDIMA